MTVTPNGCDIRLVIAALTLAALLALVLAERSLSPNEPLYSAVPLTSVDGSHTIAT
jgi:hypothetical protein